MSAKNSKTRSLFPGKISCPKSGYSNISLGELILLSTQIGLMAGTRSHQGRDDQDTRLDSFVRNHGRMAARPDQLDKSSGMSPTALTAAATP